jgi:ribonucleotide monophosphatase NagD (HAD superfamily)
VPDIGAMMRLVEASTGRRADVVIGKPNPGIVDALAEEWGLRPEDLVMVGDRLYTDIALGKTAGVRTVLVLSGETRREDLASGIYQPDLVCENLADLTRYLSN